MATATSYLLMHHNLRMDFQNLAAGASFVTTATLLKVSWRRTQLYGLSRGNHRQTICQTQFAHAHVCLRDFIWDFHKLIGKIGWNLAGTECPNFNPNWLWVNSYIQGKQTQNHVVIFPPSHPVCFVLLLGKHMTQPSHSPTSTIRQFVYTTSAWFFAGGTISYKWSFDWRVASGKLTVCYWTWP